MRQRAQWAMILLLVLGTVAGIAADSSMLRAELKASNRAQTWEFTIPVRYFPGYDVDFDGGSSIDLNDDLGWGFGFGYNFSEKMNLNFEFAWMSANYKATFASADTPALPDYTASGTYDASSTTVNFTYNFMPKTFTPYVSVGAGWTWIDSNIPVGPPDTFCWYDPWYGTVCSGYQNTAETSGWNYGFGLGVRFEPKESFFLRVGANDNWQDFGDNADDPDFWSYRLDLGWRF